MNAFDIFAVAQTGMDRQQQALAELGTRMALMPGREPDQSGFARQVIRADETGTQTAAAAPLAQDTGTSWLGNVLGVTESLRLYRMNATVASAARSMIERSLDISGK